MPSNEQRREAARRKLERQLESRAARARRRKQLTIAGAVVAVIALVGGVTFAVITTRGSSAPASAGGSSTSVPLTPQAAGVLPAGRSAPLPDTVTCAYNQIGTAAKPNDLPKTDGIPTTSNNVSVTLTTNQGPIGLSLDATKAPCTVNSFASLVGQGFYNTTPCHRITTADSLKVLQCGDPTGSGSGGPGYAYANEYPTDQYAPTDPALEQPVPYVRGTVAMANAGPNTNGSQFFLVFGDSQLPPNYTIFGTVDATGLSTLDKIAAAGVAGGGQDGAPALATTITTAQIDL